MSGLRGQTAIVTGATGGVGQAILAQEPGANVLVDDDPDLLVEAVRTATMPAERPPLYGDGQASGRIAAALYASPPK